jgi:hypothetical protein
MAILMGLAFIEDQNSLTISPDPTMQGDRPDVPKGLTEALEITCLFILGAFGLLETWLVGKDINL